MGKSGKLDVFAGLDPEVKVRSRKMMMWLIIFAVVMLFAGITSALIVLYGKVVWLRMVPPSILWVSNAIIVLSSVTLIAALRVLRKGNHKLAFTLHVLTLVLGLAFAYTQNAAWKNFADRGLGYTVTKNEEGIKFYRWNSLNKMSGEYGVDYWFEINGETLVKEGDDFYKPSDPSSPVTAIVNTTFNAFGALLSVLIYVHIIHLMIGLIYLVVNTVRMKKGIINKDNTLSIYISGMYWHFLGILWLYLFAFMFYIF